MKYIILLTVALLTGSLHASVPLPDLVFYGRLYTPTGERVRADQQDEIEVRVSVSNSSSPEPILLASVFEMFTSDETEAGDVYVLRIPRQSGPVVTGQGAGIVGDRLHITFAGHEVRETLENMVFVAGTPSEVFELNLNNPIDDPPPSDAFAEWIAQWGLTETLAANHADPDGDRFVNYLEWIYGLNPTIADGADRVPTASIVSDDNGLQFVAVTYFRPTSTTLFDDVVRVSSDLVVWDDTEAKIEVVGQPESMGDGTERLTVRFTDPIGSGSDSLAILQVTFRESEN